jgi:hypothetical protein
MTAARQDHTAALLGDGTVLLAGGNPPGGSPLRSAELYRPASDDFRAVGNMTTPRTRHTATLLGNGQVLIAGGSINGGPAGALATGELYDPRTRTFKFVTNAMQSARVDHTATLLPDGRVLLAGGRNQSGAALATADLFDPKKGVFAPVQATLVTPRFSHTATARLDGVVVIAGGVSVGGTTTSSELFEPQRLTFTAGNDMADARQQAIAVLLAGGTGQMLFAGGSSSSNNGNPIATAEIYQP